MTDEAQARRLTARADWEDIAAWCDGELLTDTATGILSIVVEHDADGWSTSTAVRGDWIVRDAGDVVVVPGRHAEAILRAAGTGS